MLFMFSAQADQTITDQFDRQVTIPDRVDKMVVLRHQTLSILVQLNVQQDVVGMISSWKKQLGPEFARFVPTIATLPTPGDLTSVNIESLLAVHPQVVFVANYTPAEVIQQIQNVGIPVMIVSLRKDATEQQSKMNPIMADEEQVYNEGSRQDIHLIANVIGHKPQAETLIDYAFATRPRSNTPVAKIPDAQEVHIYMANLDLMTHGSGEYTGLMMQHTGGLNVVAANVKGVRQAALEQVLVWNPQVIFAQDRYPQAITEIQNDPNQQGTDTARNHRAWLTPEYAKAWGYLVPEALAIGELWMAKKLYPGAYKNADISARVRDHYRRFYCMNWQPDAAR